MQCSKATAPSPSKLLWRFPRMRHWLFQPANRQNPEAAPPMTASASALAPEILDRRARTKAWFEALQQRICAELERLEDLAPAELYPEAAGTI